MIDTPGKFEGCPDYAPYFWDLVMNGESEYNEEQGVHFVKIEPEDLILFPELEDEYEVQIFEDENRFIHCEPVKLVSEDPGMDMED